MLIPIIFFLVGGGLTSFSIYKIYQAFKHRDYTPISIESLKELADGTTVKIKGRLNYLETDTLPASFLSRQAARKRKHILGIEDKTGSIEVRPLTQFSVDDVDRGDVLEVDGKWKEGHVEPDYLKDLDSGYEVHHRRNQLIYAILPLLVGGALLYLSFVFII